MRPPHPAIALCLALCTVCFCAPTLPNYHNFRYEKLQNYGLGKRVIPNYRRVNVGYAYPEPLGGTGPVGAAGAGYVRGPYRSIYQGARRRSDRRVYMKRFDFAAKPSGHRIFCQAITDCEISHVAIETGGGVPVLLRGGAGYRHLSAVVKAPAGVPLRGSLKVYCRGPISRNAGAASNTSTSCNSESGVTTEIDTLCFCFEPRKPFHTENEHPV